MNSQATTTMTTQAAILVRVSGPGQHAENQLPGLEEWAVSLGLEVVTVYEVRQSAWKGAHRKALTEVYKDARAGPVPNPAVLGPGPAQ